MKKTLLITTLVIAGLFAQASSTTSKQIDSINATGGSSLAVPSTGTTFDTDSNTVTLTNKSISGATNTLSAIPASAISSGQLGVANGGTGASTLTSNGMVYGNGTSAVGITTAGSQYQVFQAGASGVPTVGALNLGQAAAVTGQLPVASGGVGTSSLVSNGIIYGSGTAPVGITSAGTQFQVLQAGSGGVPTFAAVSLGQSSAVSGQLGVANGGTGAASLTSGSVVIGNGTSTVTLVAPSTSGNVLTSNGSTWTSTAPVSSAPTLTGTQAAPFSVTAGTGVTLTTPTYVNMAFISASGAGTTTVTATPSITACTAAGQSLTVIGESGTNLVKLQDTASLAGSKLNLNGNWTSALNSQILLSCDGNGFWNEVSRSN